MSAELLADLTDERDIAGFLAPLVDRDQLKELIDAAYERAKQLLEDGDDKGFALMVKLLQTQERIDAAAVKRAPIALNQYNFKTNADTDRTSVSALITRLGAPRAAARHLGRK